MDENHGLAARDGGTVVLYSRSMLLSKSSVTPDPSYARK